MISDLTRTFNYERCQLTLQWAAMNTEHASYPELIRYARKYMPRLVSTWELEAGWLEAKQAPPETMEAFWKRWATNFHDETDLRLRGQVQLLNLYRTTGDERAAERLEREIQLENKSERFDLAITVAAESIFLRLDQGEWDAAQEDYGRAMARFRTNAGGHLFYNLVRPYVERCLDAGKPAHARAALEDLDKDFKAQPNSLLDQDIRDLTRQVGSVQ